MNKNNNDGAAQAAKGLARLYPGKTEEEIAESRAELRRYFDLGWLIYQRLRKNRSVDKRVLTDRKLNPMVNAPLGSDEELINLS